MIVITSAEMSRVEKLSIEKGADDCGYMERAGEGIAAFIESLEWDGEVTLLVGKGNNGGDAFVVGRLLCEKGVKVQAIAPFSAEETSPLSQKNRTLFVESGGNIVEEGEIRGLIVDGLLGTGFQGETSGKIKELIDAANESELPIVAIDIPSGLDGTTGEVKGSVIRADYTVYLGQPKIGFFIGKGFSQIGRLRRVDFGLEQKYVEQMKGEGYLIDEREVASYMPEVSRVRHKYESGYVVALAGSPGMAGAAQLSCSAAMRCGAGIVRLFHPPEMEEELLCSQKELIRSHYTSDDHTLLQKEMKRARALLIGPGLGAGNHPIVGEMLETGIPTVLDADGLSSFTKAHGDVVMTPHVGEMCKLLGLQKTPADLHERCQAYVEEHGVTLVLKGAPTFIYTKGDLPTISVHGDPGMATAGSGDVLTGIIAALLAAGLPGKKAAILGVHLHGCAGELCSDRLTSYSVIASDLIETLPEVIATL